MEQLADLAILDYSDPAFSQDPFAWLADKGSTHVIARSDRGVEVLDYHLVREMLMHQSLGTDHANLVERMGLPESRALQFKKNMLLTHNRGDTRRRLRKLLMQLLGASQAKDMRTDITLSVSRLLSELPAGEFDIKLQFTDLLAASVYCGWVNAPLSDARFVADMSERVLRIFERNPALTPDIVSAYDELFAYAANQLQEREQDLGDDFLSVLIGYRNSGMLSQLELEDFAVMLIEASTDNTSHQLAIIIDRILQKPGLWQQLSTHAEAVPGVVREVMRLWPRSISTSRVALEAIELGNVHIPKGTSLFASFGACHRQADVFISPHEFKHERDAHPTHFNFGGGAFSCLGQFVATVELEEALTQLTAKFPGMQYVHSERRYTPMFQTVPSLLVSTGLAS